MNNIKKEYKIINIRTSITAIDKFAETNILTKAQIDARETLIKKLNKLI